MLWSIKIIIVKFQKYLLFTYFVSNDVFIPGCLVQAFQDKISPKTVPIWLHHTVYLHTHQEKRLVLDIHEKNYLDLIVQNNHGKALKPTILLWKLSLYNDMLTYTLLVNKVKKNIFLEPRLSLKYKELLYQISKFAWTLEFSTFTAYSKLDILSKKNLQLCVTL